MSEANNLPATAIAEAKVFVAGRDKPSVDIEAFPGGLRVRFDFDLRSDAWAEVCIPWEEIARAQQAMNLHMAANPDRWPPPFGVYNADRDTDAGGK